MASVLNEISQWASALPYWEQAALEKIVASVVLTDEDYDQLLQYLLEDAALAPLSEKPRPALTFPQLAAEDVPSAGEPLRLSKICKLRNVNALVPDQELTFGKAMTVIFGANGSGKSGYARVIGSAAFTRGDKQVLPDVNEPADSGREMSAEIELTDGTTPHTVCYRVGAACPEMRCFYVFDSTSVHAHLTRSNAMSFSPGGLAYLTRLADVTERVRQRLDAEIEQRTRPNPFAPLFPGETDVAKLVASLGSSTDLQALRRLGTLSPDEKRQLADLDLRIAQLKSESIVEQIAETGQVIADLEKLSARLAILERELGDDRITEIGTSLAEWHTRDAAARALSMEKFKTDYFHQTGSDLWHAFISAAHDLAQAESVPGQPYPQAESRCLLCHQPLSLEARDLLQRLWTYLEDDAQTRLADAESALAACLQTLDGVDLEFLSDEAVAYRHLQTQDKDALGAAQAYVASCRQRRDLVIQAVGNHTAVTVGPLPDNGRDDVERVIGQLQDELAELEKRNPAEEIAGLELKKTSLEHRQRLGQYLTQIEDYVTDCKWIHKANSAPVRRSTRHITQKYNELFSQLVTKRYLQLFGEMLEQLNCPRHVQVQTRGEKGRTVKQIVMETHKTITADQAPPDKVLSEGEQRAVALADFLTEVALDDGSTGVILDDPVSSLDFEWKETIASHLVTQAKHRQVVVFTHDLHFLYCLKKQVEQQGVALDAHRIDRRRGIPGWVSLDNSPMSEKEHRKPTKAQRFYEQANRSVISSDECDLLVEAGLGALRTCYEAFVMFDLFNGVIQRFDDQIRIQSLKAVAADPAMCEQVAHKHAQLSRYIGAHLHSDTSLGQKPTPEMLHQEIQEFEALVRRHKDYKKSLGMKD